jgi:hypothetical protein
MNKKILSLIILFLGVFSVMQAQNDGKIRVKGVVLDETTRQPIAFANIGIIGTAAGAASDMDGLFELIVGKIGNLHDESVRCGICIRRDEGV